LRAGARFFGHLAGSKALEDHIQRADDLVVMLRKVLIASRQL
jgi:hypothetical protein